MLINKNKFIHTLAIFTTTYLPYGIPYELLVSPTTTTTTTIFACAQKNFALNDRETTSSNHLTKVWMVLLSALLARN